MLLFPSSSLFIIIIVFLSLLLFSSAQLCDVGDLSSICIVSSPKSFNEVSKLIIISFTSLNLTFFFRVNHSVAQTLLLAPTLLVLGALWRFVFHFLLIQF